MHMRKELITDRVKWRKNINNIYKRIIIKFEENEVMQSDQVQQNIILFNFIKKINKFVFDSNRRRILIIVVDLW